MRNLPTTYDPKDVEERLYTQWESRGYFHAEPDETKKPFTIVIPPPNVTGQLHMGHALDNTLQDILIRWKRMQGYNALWQPGTDHASIATELKVIAKLAEEGINKQDLGREGFLERAWAWKEEYGGRIINQLKKLGSSCDWERERFTMDEGLSDAVLEVFMRLYDKGLIYKGKRIINWCPRCKTSMSDAEVIHEEQEGSFWHLRYPYADGSGYIEVATTRPETMLGDTAVAVHPEDPRYQDKIGRMLRLPLTDREIPVIADEYVDREFGTGAVKITPAHDPNDFEVGLRHNLEQICVLTDDGHMNELCGKYAGMDRYEARKAMVADLKEQGYLVGVEAHVHNVGTHDRCHCTVEPMVKPQWFVAMKELAKPAIEAVKTGELRFVPERFEKNYLYWLENIRDWYIEMVKSRLYGDDKASRRAALWTLREVMVTGLKLLHPYMPFITEEIFSYFCPEEETIMYAAWPEYREDRNFPAEEAEVEHLKEAIRGIRNIRSQMNVPPKQKTQVFVVTADARMADIFRRGAGFLAPLAFAESVEVRPDRTGIAESAVTIPLQDAVVCIPLDQLVDLEKEKARLEKEKQRLEGEIKRVEGKLNNAGFMAKAPAAVIEEEKAKKEKYVSLMAQIEKSLEGLTVG